MTGFLESFPRTLEKQSVLWVHELRFEWRVTEETRIEELDVVDGRNVRHVGRIFEHVRIKTPALQVFRCDARQRLFACAKIFPKLLRVSRAGKTA